MDAPAPAPQNPAPTCAGCGSSAGSPFWSGGVCLRCASLRLLGSSTDGSGATLSSSVPERSANTGVEAMPERLGPYEIIEELGRGGMGRVYAARQIGLGRIVALKVMGDASRRADFELRFLREAQTAARLRHPNLVAVHDFGRADGQWYFSMDYLEGGDLARRLRGRPFAPWEAASVVRKVTLALAHAHTEGILHRDIKPSNILLDGDEPKLADFGLATQLEAGGDLTAVTGILGTPHYLAPEALREGSAALSVASDLYALGAVLFELLTGRTPFAGAAPGALMALMESSEPPSPRLLAPAVPRDLETICLKCLERDPARRYASALALAEDLRRFLDGEPILARPLSGPARFLRWCRRRPALAAVWALVTALAVGSTVAAITIQRTLGRALAAEADSRERLREGRKAEARAVRHTTEPGLRQQALAALTDAARIRPGDDLRQEAIAALMLADIHPLERWGVSPGKPGTMSGNAYGRVIGFEAVDATGEEREPATLRFWGATNDFLRLVTPTNPVGPLHISADGALVMERFLDDSLRLWHTNSATPYLILRDRPAPGGAKHTDSFNDDCDFSPDGQFFVVGLPDKGLSLHRVVDGAEVARWTEGDHFTRVRFSSDGRYLAAICSTDVRVRQAYVIDVPSLKLASRIALNSDPNSLAWADDGRRLAISQTDNAIVVYDVLLKRMVNRLLSPVRDPNDLTFLGRGALLAMRGAGATLHIIDSVSGREAVVLENFGVSPVIGEAGSATFATASSDGIATRWQIDLPLGVRTVPTSNTDGREQAFNNSCLDFSRDGRLAISSHGRYLLLRDTETGLLLAEFDDEDTHGREATTVLFAEGDRAILRHSNYTGLWRQELRRAANGTISFGPPELLDPEPRLTMTDHSPDGRRLAFTSPWAGTGLVKVAEFADGKLRVVNRWPVPGSYSAALSPTGDRVLVNCTGTGPDLARQRVQVFRVADGTALAELPGQAFGECAWSEDGNVAMTSNGQEQSILWDTNTWKPRAALTGALGGNISTFQLSPKGAEAVVIRDSQVFLVSTTNGAQLMKLEPPGAPGLASSVRYLPDGHRFGVVWRDGRLDLFDPEAIRGELALRGLRR